MAEMGIGRRDDGAAMPPLARLAVAAAALGLVASALALWTERGPALLLDLAVAGVGFLCL